MLPRVVAGIEPEAGPIVVGAVIGAAGLLFLLEPLVGGLAVGGERVRPFALSAVVLTAGFGLGTAVFLRRGRRLFGIAHAVGFVGWGPFLLGTVGSDPALLVGVVVLTGGSAFLVGQGLRLSRRRRRR